VRGDSGSWVFSGEDVLGVVIAGSTEAIGGHFAYAIAITEVCRSISVGMDDASVHVPMPVENAITAHKVAHQGRDTVELATLYIKQMVQATAQKGSGPMKLRISNGLSTSGSFVDSLLILARICPFARRVSAKPGASQRVTGIYGKIRLPAIAISNAANSIVSKRSSIWRELHKHQELRSLEALFLIFAGFDGAFKLDQIAHLTQRTMAELGIFPIPSIHQIIQILWGIDRNHWPWSQSPDEPFGKTILHLPRILARLLYATSEHQFFVYCGPYGGWLREMYRFVDLGLIVVGDGFDAKSLASQTSGPQEAESSDWVRGGRWASKIRAFVIPEDWLQHYTDGSETQFSKFGDIVGHSQLQSLLWRLANRRE